MMVSKGLAAASYATQAWMKAFELGWM